MLRPAKQAPAQKAHLENPMNVLHYIGFDVHKKTISFFVKTAAGEIVEEGSVAAQRAVLRQWASARPQPWRGAMEATLFSGWIYDTLQPYSEQLEMAHPAKMKAICAGHAADSRTAPPAALSQPGGERSGAHEEQDGRVADGDRRPLREREAAPQEILRQPYRNRWSICCA